MIDYHNDITHRFYVKLLSFKILLLMINKFALGTA